MNSLHSTDLIELARQFFAREQSVNDVAAGYTREELIAFSREMAAEMEAAVRDLTPAQIEYRLPGKPSGWDSSGDEAQFDTSEIVTHVAAGVAFYWFGIARGLGHGRPQFPRPPRGTNVTGNTGSVLGRGGWRSVPGPELATMLHDTMNGFMSYVETLPEGDGEIKAAYEGYGELTVKGWLLLLAAHLDLHLKQLKEMQAQPNYPRG